MAELMPDASDEEFLDHCYGHLLGREPDPGGREHHLQLLAAGTPRAALLAAFVGADEFVARFNAAAKEGATRQFAPAGHFYSPLPASEDYEARYAALALDDAGLVDAARQLELAERFRAYYAELPFPLEASAEHRYHLNNGAFNCFDGIILYCFVRHLQPRMIIEVGSGYSSALMLDCCERFLPGRTALTFIDPFPAALRACLRPGDEQNCRILPTPVQTMPLETFAALGRGDILFIDSSHVSKFGSDVNHLLFKVLPLLASGVVIHFHDIFSNFDYPREWLREGRAWNEGYLVRAFLAGNAGYRILFFNDWFARHHWDYLCQHMPLCTVQPEGSPFKNCGVSLWIEKL